MSINNDDFILAFEYPKLFLLSDTLCLHGFENILKVIILILKVLSYQI